LAAFMGKGICFCDGVIFRSSRVTTVFPVGSEDPPGTKTGFIGYLHE